LESEGYLKAYVDDKGENQLQPRTMYIGSGEAIKPVQARTAENWHSNYVSDRGSQTAFLKYFGRLLVSALFLDRRLTSFNSTNIIDFEKNPPNHDLHALHTNDIARAELSAEIIRSFNKAVWSDAARGNTLCLRVSDDGTVPSAEDRHSYQKMSQYRTIESEGDGLKSYVAICVATLLGQRPITIVDEPEMCLHPPQAYNLGQFIGQHGTSRETATLVATHSSHILRGVLQSTKQLQIIRLSRTASSFAAHLVPAEVLSNALSKPTLRAEAILDGIFAQCVVVLESDADRLVYHTTLETLANEIRLDVHFAAVGGTGGITGACSLYRTLNIPVATIADLDMLINVPRMKQVLSVMASPDIAEDLLERANLVVEEIRKIPPKIEPDEFKHSLGEIARLDTNWQSHDDIQIVRELRQLAAQLDRMRAIKRGGISQFSESLASTLLDLLNRLQNIGVFLVPVGELEEWLAGENIQASKEEKWAWATEAALRIQEKGNSQGDIWDFMRRVAAYLNRPA
jgi:hypothetical protein